MDYLDPDLRSHDEEAPAPVAAPKSSVARHVAMTAIVLLAIGAAAFYFLRRQPAPAPQTQPVVQQQPTTPPVTEPPLGGEPQAIDIPPLDESDDVVRMLARMLSTNPTFVAWLASDDLIRTFTATVVKVAEGKSPATHLYMMRPRSGFSVRQRGEDVYADTRSSERYTTAVAALSSVDPAGTAQLYATLKPRIEDAYRELGYTTPPFDRMLERAIVQLLATPVRDEPILLQPGRATEYLYADPALERLSAAQKHVLRLGPRHARTLQMSLRNIAAALGIPPDRLPAVP